MFSSAPWLYDHEKDVSVSLHDEHVNMSVAMSDSSREQRNKLKKIDDKDMYW